MKTEQALFLELLKSAIWRQPADASIFKGIDSLAWQKILVLSTLQRTTALIADSIQKLPELCLPPREMYLKLILQTEEIERSNARINKALQDISADYAALNCAFILLKGQGLALNYPNPMHRTPGDLDIFLYRGGDYERVKEWVTAKGYPQEPESLKDLGFTRDDVHIENHRYISIIENRKYNNLLKQKVKNVLASENLNLQKIGEAEVMLLPPYFDAFFVFIHMFHHFVHLGVGIRQLCDWLLLLHRHHDAIDKAVFESLLDEFSLRKAASVFANAAIKYLDTPETLFPFELNADTVYSDIVMEDILDAGHFGYFRSGKSRPEEKWKGRWFSFRYMWKRSAVMGPIAPEYIRILPYVQILNRLKLMVKGSF